MKKDTLKTRYSQTSRRPSKLVGRSKGAGPSRVRIFQVAAGLAAWTPAERRWLAQHPKDLEWHDRLQEVFRMREIGEC